MLYLVLGAGGTGRTAASVLEAALAHSGEGLGHRGMIAFLDDQLAGQEINGYKVMGCVDDAFSGLSDIIAPGEASYIVAFGSTYMKERKAVFQRLRRAGKPLFNCIFPYVFIDRTAKIGEGIIIAANCVISPNARIGDNCVLCVAATLDHDTTLGENVYISPGVNLAGGVVIEDDVFIGTNAAVIPEVRVGQGAVVGAGAVVIEDVAPGTTVAGVPARPIRQRSHP